MQGPVGHFMDSGFYSKTNTEEQKAFNSENTMLRFMMGREQKWTQRRQTKGSLPRSCRSTASSL